MRTIDADAMKAEVKSLDAESNNNTYKMAMKDMLRFFIDFIDNQPTVESAPVRYGRWIQRRNLEYYCSNCGREEKHIFQKNYCPRCGAKMNNLHTPTQTQLDEADSVMMGDAENEI